MEVVFCVITCLLGIYCCEPYNRVTEIVEPENPTGAVIFLHGAGESGPVVRSMVAKLIGNFSKYPNLRLVFPTARAKRFNPFPWNGHLINIWYTLDKLKLDGVENVTEIDESAKEIERWVEEQVSAGIPYNRICVVGYSSGACMSMHFGYEYAKNLGCVGAISGYLPTTSALYKKLNEEKEIGGNVPPLYMSTGKLDFLIKSNWTKTTMKAFKSAGVPVTFNYQWDASHFMTKRAVEGLFKFIQQTIS